MTSLKTRNCELLLGFISMPLVKFWNIRFVSLLSFFKHDYLILVFNDVFYCIWPISARFHSIAVLNSIWGYSDLLFPFLSFFLNGFASNSMPFFTLCHSILGFNALLHSVKYKTFGIVSLLFYTIYDFCERGERGEFQTY